MEWVPLAWLALVACAYALLALPPWPASPAEMRAEVPGLAALESAVLPLLAAVLLTGIIRYFRLRSLGAERNADTPAPHEGGARETP